VFCWVWARINPFRLTPTSSKIEDLVQKVRERESHCTARKGMDVRCECEAAGGGRRENWFDSIVCGCGVIPLEEGESPLI